MHEKLLDKPRMDGIEAGLDLWKSHCVNKGHQPPDGFPVLPGHSSGLKQNFGKSIFCSFVSFSDESHGAPLQLESPN